MDAEIILELSGGRIVLGPTSVSVEYGDDRRLPNGLRLRSVQVPLACLDELLVVRRMRQTLLRVVPTGQRDAQGRLYANSSKFGIKHSGRAPIDSIKQLQTAIAGLIQPKPKPKPKPKPAPTDAIVLRGDDAELSLSWSAPPSWVVSEGFAPSRGWLPDPGWGDAPVDWIFWVAASETARAAQRTALARQNKSADERAIRDKARRDEVKAATLAERQQQRQKKRQEAARTRTEEKARTSLGKGGMLTHSGAKFGSVLWDNEGLYVATGVGGRGQVQVVTWSEVVGIEVDGREAMSQRLKGSTRKKGHLLDSSYTTQQLTTEAETLIELTTDNDLHVVFVDGSPSSVKAKLGELIVQIQQPRHKDEPAVGVVEAIQQLGELWRQGLLTDAEFEAAKSEQLARLSLPPES